MRGSIRTQLIVWNVLALAALLLVLGLLVRSVVVSTMMASVDRDLAQRARAFNGGPPPPRHGHGFPGPDDHAPENQPPDDGRFPDDGRAPDGDGPPNDDDRPPRDADGPPNGRQDGPPNPVHHFTLLGKPVGPIWERGTMRDAAGFARARLGETVFETVAVNGVSTRVLSRPFPDRPPFRGVAQADYPLTDVERAVASINRALLALAPVALLFAALGGALLTGRVLRQVRLLAASASQIHASDFSGRLPTAGRDEFAALAGNFNELLDRLETAFRRQQMLIEQQRRFTGDASHELKTPLTIIKGNTSLALSGGENMDEISVREVDRAADTMMCLVQDLLLLARSDAGQLGRNRVEILAREVLERAKSGLGRRPGMAPIYLEICDETLCFNGDSDELTRVFSNLLDNAARHTPPHGKILVTAKRENQNAVVTVADTGSGIAAEHLPHLGERFYRIDDARARAEGGTGLGLSICRGIVETYGGTLTFASEKNAGTTVTVTLPA